MCANQAFLFGALGAKGAYRRPAIDAFGAKRVGSPVLPGAGGLALLRWGSRGKRHAVGRHQPGDAAEVQLDAVLSRFGGHSAWVQLTASGQFGDLVKELFKTGGRDDLEDADGAVTRVPEGVPLAPRFEDQVPNLAVDDLPSEVGADPTLKDEAVLILAAVPVHRCGQGARFHGVLDERETAPRCGAINHEPNAYPAQLPKLAVLRSHDPNCRSRHLLLLSINVAFSDSPKVYDG